MMNYSDLPLFRPPARMRALVKCPRCKVVYDMHNGQENHCQCGIILTLTETKDGGFIARIENLDWIGIKPVPQIMGWVIE